MTNIIADSGSLFLQFAGTIDAEGSVFKGLERGLPVREESKVKLTPKLDVRVSRS
jgi:hypothetical protein